MSVLDLPRFFDKIVVRDGCWVWQGALNQGYGWVRHNGKSRYAHQALYECLVGLVPQGLELDHLCRNRACVNPEHLEPVSHVENCQRGARARDTGFCPQGHEWTPENIRWKDGRYRECRICRRNAERARRARRSETNG